MTRKLTVQRSYFFGYKGEYSFHITVREDVILVGFPADFWDGLQNRLFADFCRNGVESCVGTFFYALPYPNLIPFLACNDGTVRTASPDTGSEGGKEDEHSNPALQGVKLATNTLSALRLVCFQKCKKFYK